MSFTKVGEKTVDRTFCSLLEFSMLKKSLFLSLGPVSIAYRSTPSILHKPDFTNVYVAVHLAVSSIDLYGKNCMRLEHVLKPSETSRAGRKK